MRGPNQGRKGFLIDVMKTMMAAVGIGADSLVAARLGFRLACTHAADSARTALDNVTAILGSVSIFENTIVERCQRDVLAAAKYIAMSPNAYIMGGHSVRGLDPGPRF